MRKLIPTFVLALGAMSLSLPSLADARTHHHRARYVRHHHHVSRGESCAAARHRHRVNGAIIGSVGGAIVGNSMSRGNRTGGTLLGAGVGALAGNEIGKNSTRC